MTTNHSAGAQALGYLYQIWYALYLILDRDEPNLAIRIEGLDDIDVLEEGTLLGLLQGKYHLDKKVTLFDRSPDLWRTIRIWSEHVKETRISPSATTLTLFTTAKASEGSIASLLRPYPHHRDPQLACQRLRELTKKPAKKLQKGFDAFMNLLPEQQEQLVAAIRILEQSPNIPELDQKIENKLHGVHPDDRAEVREHLESWWLQQVIRHLHEGSLEPIKKSQAELKIALINQGGKLQLFENYTLDDDFDPTSPEWENDRFVRQLTAIDARQELKEAAIYERMRAWGQRTKWLDKFHIAPESIERYEEELIQEWDYERLDLEEEFEGAIDEVGERKLKKYGRELYKNVRKREIPISPEFTRRYMMRGSYHLLADEDSPRVWWHPKFPERDAL